MFKVTLAFGSFVAGACCMFFALSLIHTSTDVHASQRAGLVVENVEPVVPPLGARFIGGGMGGELQALDGIDCEKCVINASVLTYAGGAFNCIECALPRGASVQLKGAAWNTFKMLQFFGAIPGPVTPPPPQMQRTAIQVKAQQTITWIALEGLK